MSTTWCTHAGATLLRGDFNGDGAEDLLCRDPGRLWIDYADNRGVILGTTDWYLDTNWCAHSGAQLHLGDLNGDGRTDLLWALDKGGLPRHLSPEGDAEWP
ncbi:MAG: VCBS repeat-containing protein [Myxococcaceae bacterium]|nr:VCBS repeat-containing protein [Myxococcaceae bacterium]